MRISEKTMARFKKYFLGKSLPEIKEWKKTSKLLLRVNTLANVLNQNVYEAKSCLGQAVDLALSSSLGLNALELAAKNHEPTFLSESAIEELAMTEALGFFDEPMYSWITINFRMDLRLKSRGEPNKQFYEAFAKELLEVGVDLGFRFTKRILQSALESLESLSFKAKLVSSKALAEMEKTINDADERLNRERISLAKLRKLQSSL